jgi:hypothetical protein
LLQRAQQSRVLFRRGVQFNLCDNLHILNYSMDIQSLQARKEERGFLHCRSNGVASTA